MLMNHLRARTALGALYALTVFVFVAIWSVVPATPAFAYVDPSVMTYTIQAVAGLAVALSAVAGVAFRRTRRKIYELLNIDENARKISESAVNAIDPASPEASRQFAIARDAAASLAMACNEQVSSAPRKMRWSRRVVFALVMCVFMAFIVFIAPALEIFGSNGDSLVFGFGVVWWIPVVYCLAFAIVAALLLSVLRGRAFYIALMVVFALTVAAYVQSLFLNQGMMPADGGFIGWDEPFFIGKKISSGIVWVVIVAAIVVLSQFDAHKWLKAATGLACAIMVVQLVGVISVAVESSQTAVAEQDRPYVTQGSLLTVSPKSNVIVFVLDTYDTALLEKIRKTDPHFLDDFEEFTYYRNSVGTMIPTTNAIPNMLTALKPAPGQDVAEYRATKYEKSTYLSDIHELGYSIGMYSDSLMMDFNNPGDRTIADMTLNVHPVSHAPIDVWRTFICMEQCALYREMPWVLKPTFWYYTSDLNNRMIADSGSTNLNDSLYELDDAAILNMVRTQGLEPVDEGEAGAFRFIHLFGPHFPFSVNEEGENVGTNQSDQIAQAKGSMKVVTEYMAQLKELGLYDEATIVVTADHGIWYLTDDPPRDPISPIMLVKPSKAGSAVRTPVQVSDTPVSHDDIQPTVIAAMGGDGSKYGIPFDQISDPARVRYFDALTSAGNEGQHFVEYAISGDVFNMKNWEKTGNVWYGA
ncbi:MAG: sulfatase-like hydrolase/transferase [Eggerthellaceae bacterium]|nr:sulfatase-like hydrolase/transferase [Eggerthellaceae bacterium]